MGRDRVAGQEQDHFFGKVCASGEDFGGTEGVVSQHRTLTTLLRPGERCCAKWDRFGHVGEHC